ncbi:MAG TPA: polysaccharide biosynthesis/export family protein [Bacillota bacterium]|nr:polysaccharide biosynthesis/export family protein [Bacillota bacterium]
MLNNYRLLACMVCLLLICSITGYASDYHLVAGDLLDIGVYGYEELQVKGLLIRPDGKIAFPLVGEVKAEGLTPMDLSANLTAALAEYVTHPQVTVNIVKYHTVRVYVLGEVARPGMYEIEKQHNLLDALSMAGGYTPYAAKRSTYLVCKTTGQYVQVNLDNLLKKGDLSQNYELADGDVVYLAKNGMSFIRDILPWLTAAYDIKEILK